MLCYTQGDAQAVHLAKALGALPCLQTIDLSDNGLSDAGLVPVLSALTAVPSLTELNISQNVIGPDSAHALAAYVSRPSCPLAKLVMQRADVDDFEGEAFVSAVLLGSSKTLTYLDLSQNKLGAAENLNTVMPDLVTAPEALAALLRTRGCVLETLILSWNMIRLDSGVDLASSVSANASLTHLDLSDNSLNAVGGKALGEALINNRSIKRLLICNNGITAAACFTICIGVQENHALEHLSVDGNPIGEAGAKALMLIPTSCGGRCSISAKNCNTQVRDDQCWFNFSQPCQVYALDLSDSFDRSVAFQLLRIMANHVTYVGRDVSYEHPAEKGQRPIVEKMEFLQIVTTEKMDYFDEKQQLLYDDLELLRIASHRMDKLQELFRLADADKSGELSKEELKFVLDKCDVSMEDEKLNDVMLQYDVDGSGTIELNEFLAVVSSIHDDAVTKIQAICETICMASDTRPRTRYLPPASGTLRLELLDGFVKKALHQVISDADRVNMTSAALATGDVGTLLPFGFDGMKIRADEALQLYETMFRETGDKIAVLIKLLPQVANPKEAKKLIKKVTNNNIQEIQRIKEALGQAVKPILGMPCGYYYLDLADPVSRICLAQLFEHSHTLGRRRQQRCKTMDGWTFGDVSQHQNWSCFRNEIFNSTAIVLTPKEFTPIPKSGRLSFDFSTCGFRPEGIPTVISDAKVLRLVVAAELAEPGERLLYSSMLDGLLPDAPLLREANAGTGRTVFECSTADAIETAEHCQNFANNLVTRINVIMECSRREELPDESIDAGAPKTAPGSGKGARNRARTRTGSADSGSDRGGDCRPQQDPRPGLVSGLSDLGREGSPLVAGAAPVAVAGEAGPAASPCGGLRRTNSTVEGLLKRGMLSMQSKFSCSFMDSRNNSFQDLLTVKNRSASFIEKDEQERLSSKAQYRATMHSESVSAHAKAQSCLAVLVETLAGYGLCCRHLLVILTAFTLGKNQKTTYFGTYRSELVIEIFPNIIDIHNFELILKCLTPFEAACVYCRIGRLSIFNPLKPEGGGVLNLSLLEDRHVAKMILTLSAVEPGDNIKDAGFRLYYDTPNFPGWEINSLWMTEDGMQRKGFLSYNYYTGEGKNLCGCKADLRWRTAMLHSVLASESDVLLDCAPHAPPGEGELAERAAACAAFMDSTRDRWTSYLRFKPEREVRAFELST
jgi:Ran GTPase-activating protein (RanGAP) involved in mRNA processing and transport